MTRVQFVTYKGKKIFVEDFSNMKPGPDFLNQMNLAQKTIAGEPPKSVLALFDATGVSFNNEILTAMKNFTKENTPFIKAAATVGISGLVSIAMAGVSKFSGREFVNFKTREEAKEWLISR